jgi:purine-binding chemotaxis protein CheW
MLQENQVTLACFELKGGVCALDVSSVREVVRWQAVTPLPRSPSLIQGVVDLRGSVIPVVDLAQLLCGESVVPGPRTRIAVVEADGMLLGLVVDAAVDVRAVDGAALEDPPALATQAGYETARAMVRSPDTPPIPVLSLEHLLECVYRSAFKDGEVAA